MKNYLAAAALVFVSSMAACSSAPPTEPASEEIGTADSELTIACGGLCPPGQEPVGFACSTSCAGQCPNAVSCAVVPLRASISASPTTVSVRPGAAGTTRICWQTSGVRSPLWIRVRVNDAAGTLFTKESDNGHACENAPWIVAGNSYDFRIHTANADNAPVLAAVRVTGVEQTGGTNPPGNFCETGVGSCPAGQDCHCGDRCMPRNMICP